MLVDVTVIGERDAIPAGFTCVDFTSDTRMFSFFYLITSKQSHNKFIIATLKK